MVTARTDSQDVVTGLNAGADEYLTKPIDHAASLRVCAPCSDQGVA
jgi:DNA-binding response OmpR family regulator